MILKTYPPPPQLGDVKTISRFAWLPTRVEDKLVWLESYEEKFTYTERYSSLGGTLRIPYNGWKSFQTNRIVNKPGLPDFKNPPPTPVFSDGKKVCK